MHDFKITLANLLKAKFPFVYIPTWEEERILETIESIASNEELIKTKRNVLTWKITTGMGGDDIPNKEATKNPIKALEFIEDYEGPSIFVLLDFHIFLGDKNQKPDGIVIRKLRDLIIKLKQSPAPKNIIFVSPSTVLPDELQKDVTILEFDLPTMEEITELLDEMIEANQESGRILIEISPDEKERLVKAAVGLTLQEAENAFARAMVDDGCLDISDLEIILEEKSQIIKKIGILEFIESDVRIKDVGGLENLKKWLRKRDKSWLDSAKKYCLPAPKGVLITGVPGCGKSLIAKSISSVWQLPLLRLDVSRIFSGIVGSSEENMRRAIQVAEALSEPLISDSLEKHEGHLLDYGDEARLDFGVLTNGDIWKFYNIKNRNRIKIQILNNSLKEIKYNFKKLMSKENVFSGKNIQYLDKKA